MREACCSRAASRPSHADFNWERQTFYSFLWGHTLWVDSWRCAEGNLALAILQLC